jgi:hypothetical protein
VNLMSSSPTKSDAGLPTPNTMAFGPPPNRRGHAHRRSAALGSVSDLSSIMKPSDPNIIRGGSAPCSPNRDDAQVTSFQFPEIAAKDTVRTDPESPPSKSSRARVGFSDTVQFIPRPLSLVSSESSGTTIRAGGHSVSGSLSSIISAPSPPAKERILINTETRPKTAAARLDGNGPISPTLARPSPRRHRSNPLLTEEMLPPSPSTPKSLAKKWSFFGPGDCSPNSRPTSAASSKELQPQIAAPSSPTTLPSDIPLVSTEQTSSRRSSISRKPSTKKQKKVKSWAGSILTRKARQRTQKQQNRRSPTPPNRSSYGSIQENPIFEVKQPEPDIPEIVLPERPEINTDFSSWVPRRVQTSEDDTTMSPMIDLDAALGPFNTPSGRDAEWDAVIGSVPTKKGKRMHSAAGMGNFGGPGMHYHRRAASSPELENPRFGMRHLNSSSTMADVFEEDEEDAWEDAKTSDKDFSGKTDDEEGSGIDIKVVDADDMDGEKTMDWTLDNSKRGIKRKGSGLSEGDRRQLSSSMKSTQSSSSLKDEPIIEESTSPVEIFDDSYSMRPNSRAQSSDSTATPPFRARQPPKDLAPVDVQPFSLQPPYLTPTSPHSTIQSSFPSPRSPFSYDTQRISTAPSSIHDEGTFQSLLLGEPGPELRMSIDEVHDVPSLTSSNSTMTRDTNTFPTVSSPQLREGQRSASFSAAATRKRSSMASLSRLISSSHGEKSKLSMEMRAPSLTDGEKKDKASKSNRISRLMQFWKPKDST